MPESETGDAPVTVEWLGASFRVADRIGRMPALRFAKIASLGADSSELAGMAAMYDLLKACIHGDDWNRFEAHADTQAASDDDLWDAIKTILSRQADRPTSRPSDSSDGPSATVPSSTSTPAGRAIDRLAGRPDLQIIVEQAATAQQEMQTA